MPSRKSALPSPRSAWSWLVEKEWRELVASRAWWVMLVAMGPLVGVCFMGAVHTYAEISGLGGTAAGQGEALSPLVGVWAPTFSACELAAVFLLPFVAIRLIGGDRQSGALKLELQSRMTAFTRMAAKALVLMAGWLVAFAAPFVAVLLWKSYGGAAYAPELAAVALGHLLNAALTIALAAAAAAITEHPSTAAIVTLGFTVGTWIVNFVAAVQGGVWERVAGYTPTAMVVEFQHGLLRLDLVLTALILIAGGLVLAAVWMRIGIAVRRRTAESVAVGLALTILMFTAAHVKTSWDLSENRMNSFSESEERALRQIRVPLRIEAHLAAEDPRRMDLETKALKKLRRVMPNMQVQYIAATSTGLFEQTSAHYGEVWYYLGGRKEMSRITSAEGVLETIFSLAGIAPPQESPRDRNDAEFRGHPLAVPPKGAAFLFYGVWPAVVIACGFFIRMRSR